MSIAAQPAPSLTPHQWAGLRSELLWVYDHAPASLTVDHTYQQGHWAWYLRSGHARIQRPQGRAMTVRAGTWVFPPRERLRIEFSPDLTLLSVHFLCQWPGGNNVFTRAEPITMPGADCPELLRRAERLERLTRRHFPHVGRGFQQQLEKPTDYPLFLRLQNHFCDWLGTWFSARTQRGARVTEQLRTHDNRALSILRLLNEAPLEHKFPAAQLVRDMELSEVHLTRLFVASFGISPAKYWEQRRMETARRLLEASALSHKEIAFRLGFRSAANFSVWFGRLQNATPGQYRRAQATTGRA
ncbi:AraC family transcriptional regulator [Verrucomicrobia bacterium LW23]|nr:AraC family transcriptional regulator [Verrucomicrobia bacterium LW23]